MKEGLPLRGLKVIAYHKSWAYFNQCFGLEEVGYVEPKPGIPPSAKHVRDIIDLIESRKIGILTVPGYFERNNPEMIAQRTGIKVTYLTLHCGSNQEFPDDFALMDYWIKCMVDAARQ
ncbi:MAG TPA: zinc ABC transporter substrate-binding protein [Candidatus Glassbacteria bacterium]|nr:zinc ABC transporter substrate-binding protein [Candidatus Glassbacteria bacterium]